MCTFQMTRTCYELFVVYLCELGHQTFNIDSGGQTKTISYARLVKPTHIDLEQPVHVIQPSPLQEQPLSIHPSNLRHVQHFSAMLHPIQPPHRYISCLRGESVVKIWTYDIHASTPIYNDLVVMN